MKKISKKIIHFKFINYFVKNSLKNFFLMSVDTFKNLNDDLNLLIYKKGLYRYLLPGKFNNVKLLFKNHTYINFEFIDKMFVTVINNKNIIVINYNNFIFLNNEIILKNKIINDNFFIFKSFLKIKFLLFFFLIYFI